MACEDGHLKQWSHVSWCCVALNGTHADASCVAAVYTREGHILKSRVNLAESLLIISWTVWPWKECERCKQLAGFVLTKMRTRRRDNISNSLNTHTQHVSNTMAGLQLLTVHNQHMCHIMSAWLPRLPLILEGIFNTWQWFIIHRKVRSQVQGLDLKLFKVL